jgi:hypothetical protein
MVDDDQPRLGLAGLRLGLYQRQERPGDDQERDDAAAFEL